MEPLLDPGWLRTAGVFAGSLALAAAGGALLGKRLEAAADAPDVCERIQRTRGHVVLTHWDSVTANLIKKLPGQFAVIG